MSSEKRALITGLQGFTGRYMAEELVSRGYQVYGVIPGTYSIEAPSDGFSLDMREFNAVHELVQEWKPDVVVHLAGIAFVEHGDANAFYDVNLLGTRNLLEALTRLSQKPQAILLASSANVYGNASEGMLDESAPVAPANDYAVSKLAMEYMARLYFNKLPIVITRPFNYTGLGQPGNFLVPKIVAHFRRKASVIELGNIDVWRDFGDVRSVVRAYRGLLEQADALGGTVNVCSERKYSLREIIDLCQTITGHHIQIEVNSAFVRRQEVRSLCGNATRLRNLVNTWEPIPLCDTLQWMLDDNIA